MVQAVTAIPFPVPFRAHAVGPSAQPGPPLGGAGRLPFLTGPENRLVGALFTKLAAGGDPQTLIAGVNRLVLTGPSGSGKTHLASGLADLWATRPGSGQVTYITAPDFRRQLDQAIKSNSAHRFREQMRSSSVLVLDDLHLLPLAPYVQTELLGTLDALSTAGMVLATSSLPPASVPGLWPAIASRLAAGLMLQLAPLGEGARGELLLRCLQAADRKIDGEAIELFVQQVDGEAPQVLRVAAELCACVPRQQTIDAAKMIAYLRDRSRRAALTVDDIVKLVARYHQLSPRLLASGGRRRSLVEARAVVIYLARQLLGTSFEQLGQALGGRDHSTIMHSFRKTQFALSNDPRLRACIGELKRLLQAA